MKKSMIMSTVAMILVVVVALTAATFAWFTANISVTANGTFNAESTSASIMILKPTSTEAEALLAELQGKDNWTNSVVLDSRELVIATPYASTTYGAPEFYTAADQEVIEEEKEVGDLKTAGVTGYDGTLTKAAFAYGDNGRTVPAGPTFYNAEWSIGGVGGKDSILAVNNSSVGAATDSAGGYYKTTIYIANFGPEALDVDLAVAYSAFNNGATNDVNAAAAVKYYITTADYVTTDAEVIDYTEGFDYGLTVVNTATWAENKFTALTAVKDASIKRTGLISAAPDYERELAPAINTATNAIVTNSIVAVTVYMWLDGWTAENNAADGYINFGLTFSIA